jgi:hypothetical protein
MAGLRGNEAWLMFAKQAGKGTLATTASSPLTVFRLLAATSAP